MASELKPLRRVVTGHDDDGRAVILMDAEPGNVKRAVASISSTLIWSSDVMPIEICKGLQIEDMGARQLGTAPPPNGTRFCVIDLAPGAPHLMHRTESQDYVIVISGEIEMLVDEASTLLTQGDVVVMRGTNHAWINRGTDVARIAFVLIDAIPLGIGGPIPRGHSAMSGE
jgi:quercetin dioxygenase-like cupin family protein